MTIIDIPKPAQAFSDQLELVFDLDKEELWVSKDCLPKDCVCKAGLTTIAMLRRNNKLYLPLDWCINEWDGPIGLIEIMKERRQRELACLDEYNEHYEPINVEAAKPNPTTEPGPFDEHTGGSEELNLCSTRTDGACSSLCE